MKKRMQVVVLKRDDDQFRRNSGNPAAAVHYGECRKNQAANVGRYAVDGCGEFMACGEEGTSGALTCAACGCHRNFHRQEVVVCDSSRTCASYRCT
ncbi:mini zinc finger protein 3-like [Andrographis paniculata]|uniref:mini zinc finger protein 3-like n=1 Tax=Andrographis paniculata TaxID=175694 RepID=UPI0021E7627D|nr:mini zinc finger protein 3-like [Andrographis paniculata]